MNRFSLIAIFLIVQGCANQNSITNAKKNNINETVFVSAEAKEKEELILNQGPSIDKVTKVKATQAKKVLGVFLTGGTYRTFAYPEVLNEFDKNSIKVHLISGYEMGALVASLFAKFGSARDIEWRIFKLKNELKDYEPYSKDWLKSLKQFISTTFGKDGIQDYRIALAIPIYDSQNQKTIFAKRGTVSEYLELHFEYFYQHARLEKSNLIRKIELADLNLDIPIVVQSSENEASSSGITLTLNNQKVKRVMILDSKKQGLYDLKYIPDFIQGNKDTIKEFVNNLLRDLKNEENHH